MSEPAKVNGLNNMPSTRPLTREERRAMAAESHTQRADAEVIALLPTARSGEVVAFPIDKLAYNPQNPRSNDFDVSDLESIATKQLQAGRGVSAAAYLRLWPEHSAVIGDAEAIAVIGNRRKRACHVYGRPTLDVVIDDSMASSRAEFMKWTLLENIARANLNILEEARGIAAMVDELGTAAAVALTLGRTEAFVSQRRTVLKLDPMLQAAMVSGELAYYRARDMARLPVEEQVQRWVAELEAKEAAETGDPAAKGAAKPRAPRTPVTVPQITKALGKWAATPEVLAPALVDYLDDTQLRTLMGQLLELQVKHENERQNEGRG